MKPRNTSVDALNKDIMAATEQAYQTIAAEGLPLPEVHKLGVCYQASSLVVNSLLENGHSARHERRGGWSVVEHSYVAITTGTGTELLVDPTWQQFLPATKWSDQLPRVLVGERSDIIAKARKYGVDEASLTVWHNTGPPANIETHQKSDQDAARAADEAAKTGGWERFMASGR